IRDLVQRRQYVIDRQRADEYAGHLVDLIVDRRNELRRIQLVEFTQQILAQFLHRLKQLAGSERLQPLAQIRQRVLDRRQQGGRLEAGQLVEHFIERLVDLIADQLVRGQLVDLGGDQRRALLDLLQNRLWAGLDRVLELAGQRIDHGIQR